MQCYVITVCHDCQLNAAYCDEVVRIEEKVARVKEERRQVALFALILTLFALFYILRYKRICAHI